MNEPVRIAVAGAGLIGQAHIRRILDDPGARLAAIIDLSPTAPEQAASLGVPAFADLAEGLRAARRDGVVIATPNQFHVSHGLLAVEAGVPMLLQKPVSGDLASAMRLVDAAEAAGVPILVGHHRRHNSLMQHAHAAVASGGVVLINLAHVIDHMSNLCGEIAAVQAAASNATRGFLVEGTAAVLLHFAGGALGTLTISNTAVAPWS